MSWYPDSLPALRAGVDGGDDVRGDGDVALRWVQQPAGRVVLPGRHLQCSALLRY